MKILIQQFSDNRYLAEGNAWTLDRSLARVFATSIDALDHVLDRHLRGVDIVFGFPDERYDLKLNHFAS